MKAIDESLLDEHCWHCRDDDDANQRVSEGLKSSHFVGRCAESRQLYMPSIADVIAHGMFFLLGFDVVAKN